MKNMDDKGSQLELIEKHIDQLPLLPGVVFELMKCDPEAEDFFDHIYDLASNDPPLTTLIIGYANSAVSSPSQPIDSLRTALTRVGALKILQLVLSLSVAKVFIPNKDEHKDLWRHSLHVAHIASFVAKKYTNYEVKPETAYMCGLLHDIGRFVLLQFAPTALTDTDVRGWSSPDELILVEEEVLGFHHCDVGYLACKKLNLPPLLTNIVRYHHHKNIIDHQKVPKLLQHTSLIVQLSDSISIFIEKNSDWHEWGEKNTQRNISYFHLKEKWSEYDLPISSLADALPVIFKEIERSCVALGIN